jgi:hypothetical protein
MKIPLDPELIAPNRRQVLENKQDYFSWQPRKILRKKGCERSSAI